MKMTDSMLDIDALKAHQPLLWVNPEYRPSKETLGSLPLRYSDISDAETRLSRFAPLLAHCFAELEASNGIIESELIVAPYLQQQLMAAIPADRQGKLWIKADHSLPVAGSVKARGGIYEVLVIAETIACKAGLMTEDDNSLALASENAKQLFAQHTVTVGSTGNLGLSIGVMAAALGFKAVVHMSADAKSWKKTRLRDRGVTVIEHEGDYASAVAAGREAAENDAAIHFIDDENSLPLFLGYSVAALRLKDQLEQANILVDQEHPLFVYIPCGVGGAPGGITFGLKHVFGDNVHCFFAEPTDSPCMMVYLAYGNHDDSGEPLSVYDIGLNNKTEADGLAVAAASKLVGDTIKELVSGIFTVPDQDLFSYLYVLNKSENIKVEPSSTAAFAGPEFLLNSEAGKDYITGNGLERVLSNATHLLWTTGGAFVPASEYQCFYEKGRDLVGGSVY